MDDKTEIKVDTQTYPLKDTKVIAVVERLAPDLVEKFKLVDAPVLSINPDELERWESGEIKRRQYRIMGEDDFGYALRLLYEETFSVNQFPTAEFKGSCGLTVGGLVSHFLTFNNLNGVSLSDFKDGKLGGGNLREILRNEPDLHVREQILNMAEMITYGDMSRRMPPKMRFPLINNPDTAFYSEYLDVYGARLLALVSTTPELTENVSDPQLRNLIGMKDGVEITRMDYLRIVWKRFSGKVLTTRGTYKTEEELNAVNGFKELVLLRTHPEFQFVYKHRSASGLINEANSRSAQQTNPTAD